MPCSFTYTGTDPDTVVSFTHNPDMGDWSHDQKWLSPFARAAGREDTFVYDKSVTENIQTLHWTDLIAADRTALLAFLAVVNGIDKAFDYTDPAGDSWTARIWNSREIRESLVAFQRTDVTIELLVTAA